MRTFAQFALKKAEKYFLFWAPTAHLRPFFMNAYLSGDRPKSFDFFSLSLAPFIGPHSPPPAAAFWVFLPNFEQEEGPSFPETGTAHKKRIYFLSFREEKNSVEWILFFPRDFFFRASSLVSN